MLSWDCSLKTKKWHQPLPNLNFPALPNWVEWPVISNNAKSLIDALPPEQKSRLSLLKIRTTKKLSQFHNFFCLFKKNCQFRGIKKMIWEINTQQCWNDQKNHIICTLLFEICVRKKNIKMRIWYEYLRVF